MRPPAVTAVCSCTYNAKHYNSESYSDMLVMHDGVLERIAACGNTQALNATVSRSNRTTHCQ